MISNLRFPICDFKSSFVNRQSKIPLRGLTLVELLVSIAVTAILMLTIGSVMLVATKAMPDANGPANQIIVASNVAEQLAAELQYAITFTERDVNAVEFTVADRDANGVPEMIRYAWSGTAGDPLTREYNDGSAVTVAQNVDGFALTYVLETITSTSHTRIIFDDFEAGAADYVLSGPGDPWYLATTDPFQGLQYLEANRTGASNDAYATRSVDTTGFTDIVLEYHRRRVGLDTIDNFAVDVSSNGGLNWITLESSTGGSANDAGYINQEFLLDSTFDENPDMKIRFTTECGAVSEYGRIDNVEVTGIGSGGALTAVRITLQIGSDASTSVETAVRILNAPEVTQ